MSLNFYFSRKPCTGDLVETTPVNQYFVFLLHNVTASRTKSRQSYIFNLKLQKTIFLDAVCFFYRYCSMQYVANIPIRDLLGFGNSYIKKKMLEGSPRDSPSLKTRLTMHVIIADRWISRIFLNTSVMECLKTRYSMFCFSKLFKV